SWRSRMPTRRCSGDPTRNNPPNDQNAWPPRLAAGSWSSSSTRRPASASSAVATRPARPAPTTMTSASSDIGRNLRSRERRRADRTVCDHLADRMTTAEASQERTVDPGERAAEPLELFFDLVFVFALTQVTALMAEDPTWEGLFHGMLVLAALWWAWASYSWLTNAIDTSRDRERLLVFAAMAGMLVAGLAAPGAFGDDGVVFAVAYLVVRWLHIFIFAEATDGDVPGAV